MSEEDYKAIGEIKNQWIETKDEYLDMALNVIDNLKIKNKQLEEIIDELKDRITIKLRRYINEKDYVIDDVALDELLQILNKIKEN